MLSEKKEKITHSLQVFRCVLRHILIPFKNLRSKISHVGKRLCARPVLTCSVCLQMQEARGGHPLRIFHDCFSAFSFGDRALNDLEACLFGWADQPVSPREPPLSPVLGSEHQISSLGFLPSCWDLNSECVASALPTMNHPSPLVPLEAKLTHHVTWQLHTTAVITCTRLGPTTSWLEGGRDQSGPPSLRTYKCLMVDWGGRDIFQVATCKVSLPLCTQPLTHAPISNPKKLIGLSEKKKKA